MTTQTQTKKDQYATCEECGRNCYTGGEHDEEYICEDCEDEDLAYDCEGCGQHLYITEMAKCEERELCAECVDSGRRNGCDCPVCVEAKEECESEVSEESEEFNVDARDAPNIFPYKKCSVCGRRGSCGLYREGVWFCENCDEEDTFDDLLGDDRLDFSNPTNVAQFTAFVQANFTREEIFPETKPIITSDSISGEVSRELETLQAQNARLVAENQRLQQQLVAIKSLLSSN